MKSEGWVGTIRGKPRVGDSAERTRAVSERDIALFTEITGDRNPLHYDSEVAARSVFGGLIVQGGITSGILNAIVAEDLPGPGTVFLGVEWKFVKAVYVGDVIAVESKLPRFVMTNRSARWSRPCVISMERCACPVMPPRIPWRCGRDWQHAAIKDGWDLWDQWDLWTT